MPPFGVGQNLHLAIARLDTNVSTMGHSLSRVPYEIQQNLLRTRGIHLDDTQSGIETELRFDVFSDEPNQQVPQSLGDLVEREQARLQTRRTCDGKQPHQRAGLNPCFLDFFCIFASAMARLDGPRTRKLP